MENKNIINIDDFVNYFKKILPGFKKKYKEHINFHEEFLGHVFFEDDICCDLQNIAISNDKLKLEQIFDLFESALSKGDEYLQELIVITILVGIHDNQEAWNISKKYMKKNTIEAAKTVENFWE